ncbi:hypothetical protein ES703_107523 [subsurface metagenome]
MSKAKKDAIGVVVSSAILALLIWHVASWHNSGMYLEMSRWLQAGKGYITVLYNLGMMLVMGVVLGYLMEKVTDLIAYGLYEIRRSEEEAADSR